MISFFNNQKRVPPYENVDLQENIRCNISDEILREICINLASIPNTTCHIESIFSCLKNLTTYSRNNLSSQRIDDLMIINGNRQLYESMDFELLANQFVSQKTSTALIESSGSESSVEL